jgi:hypothetical protein
VASCSYYLVADNSRLLFVTGVIILDERQSQQGLCSHDHCCSSRGHCLLFFSPLVEPTVYIANISAIHMTWLARSFLLSPLPSINIELNMVGGQTINKRYCANSLACAQKYAFNSPCYFFLLALELGHLCIELEERLDFSSYKLRVYCSNSSDRK